MARKSKWKSKKSNKRRNWNNARRRQWGRPPVAMSNAARFWKLLEWLLPNDGIFADLKLHGNTSWLPRGLVFLALCWSWSQNRFVTDAFMDAVEWCQIVVGGSPLTTYQGFLGALVRWTDPILSVLWPVLHQRMEQIGGEFWRIDGWVAIAFDGSRSTAPRTQSNESSFCAPNYGHGKTAKYRKKKSKGMRRKKNEKNKAQPQEPQAWITMLWHMGLRLPWMWKLGPSNSSERIHVMDMMDSGEFPEDTLFCGDAGFVGYPLWTRIAETGNYFLVRVGANVSLLSGATDCIIRRCKDHVLCWPRTAREMNLPPLRLRLVKVRIGKQWMWMLTNVLDPKRLTSAQIVNFYKLRWGIEVEFRGLKQTLDCAKLCCRNSARLLAELNWSILAMAVAELFALKEQLPAVNASPHAQRGNPQKRSLANTMRSIRKCLTHLKDVPKRGDDIQSQLRRAVTDSYTRKAPKRSRYRPPNPDKKPLGNPKVRKITQKERRQLQALKQHQSTA